MFPSKLNAYLRPVIIPRVSGENYTWTAHRSNDPWAVSFRGKGFETGFQIDVLHDQVARNVRGQILAFLPFSFEQSNINCRGSQIEYVINPVSQML